MPARASDRIRLVMARGAFGSGEHETTASCLEVLERLPDVSGARVLDLGSGTGILAIAALALGATRAVCVDPSARAVASARRNCELNGVSGRVEHVTGELRDVLETNFDLVVANLYGDLLIDVAAELAGRTRAGGWLLLSGIEWSYNFELRRRLERAGCELVENRLFSEYSTLLLRR